MHTYDNIAHTESSEKPQFHMTYAGIETTAKFRM